MGKDKKRSDDSILDLRDAPAEKAIILLCEKCGRKAGGKDDNFAYGLQKELKHAAADRFGKHQVRTVITSCFDICPKDRVVACVIPLSQKGQGHAQFFELRAESKKKAESALLDFVESLNQ